MLQHGYSKVTSKSEGIELATTTSGRAKELVKQGLSDRSGMIAFGTVSERFGKTAGVAKLIDVFQFQYGRN